MLTFLCYLLGHLNVQCFICMEFACHLLIHGNYYSFALSPFHGDNFISSYSSNCVLSKLLYINLDVPTLAGCGLSVFFSLFLSFLIFSSLLLPCNSYQWPCKTTSRWRYTVQCSWNSWIKHPVNLHYMPGRSCCNTWHKTPFSGYDSEESKEVFHIWDSSAGW